MMETKEYIVCLNRGIDYDEFWNEIENESPQDGFTPSRRVDIVDNRDASLRQCHYALTDKEADKLRNDPRVYSVDLPTPFKPMKYATQVGNFTKTTVDSGDYVNWALRRCIESTNPYGTSNEASGDYTYCLDGTGVDVVIQDTGIQPDHPEFQDANGVSRVQLIDWFAASGIPYPIGNIQDPDFYGDYDGHGTHVAGIVAGKKYGWAKNAHIYSVKVRGLDPHDEGFSVPLCFDVIIGWHNAKKAAGNNRPTIVNMSWGYGTYFTSIAGGVYRGTSWTGTTRRTSYGMVGANYGGVYYHGVHVNYVDVSIQEMIDAGIHVCIAAGNDYQKIDVPGGLDYDNYYQSLAYGPVYYHRGSSPYDNEAIMVGSIDSTVYDANTDQKSEFSNCGPGVDIYAPGSNIMSATSLSNFYNASTYFWDDRYKQVNISGTSMASPQVCGMGALFLQLEPTLTPAQLKRKIQNASTSNMHTTNKNDDYMNFRSISDGIPRMMYNPYNNNVNFGISNGLTVQLGAS